MLIWPGVLPSPETLDLSRRSLDGFLAYFCDRLSTCYSVGVFLLFCKAIWANFPRLCGDFVNDESFTLLGALLLL